MRIKEWFVVPAGTKVTEKVFGRVLCSSVCSILLCMACLAGSTWALFSVGINNTDNVIHIATVSMDVDVTSGGSQVAPATDGSYSLPSGTYAVQLKLKSNGTGDELAAEQSPAYVTMAVRDGNSTQYYFYTFPQYSEVKSQQISVTGGTASVSFSVSWVQPTNATAADGSEVTVNAVSLQQEESTPETTDSTDPTENTEATA